MSKKSELTKAWEPMRLTDEAVGCIGDKAVFSLVEGRDREIGELMCDCWNALVGRGFTQEQIRRGDFMAGGNVAVNNSFGVQTQTIQGSGNMVM